MIKNKLKKMSYILALTVLLGSKNVYAKTEEKTIERKEETTEKEEYKVENLYLIEEGERFHLCICKPNFKERPDNLSLDAVSKLSNFEKEELEQKKISYVSQLSYYQDILDEEYFVSETIRGFNIYDKVKNKENHNESDEEKLIFWADSTYFASSTGNFYYDCFTNIPETQTKNHSYYPLPEEKINFYYRVGNYFETPTITLEDAEELVNTLNNNPEQVRKKTR